MRTLSVALAAMTLSGCMSYNGPWANGRLVLVDSTSTDVTKFYKLVSGGEPLETTGTRGFGDNCEDANKSTGSSVVTTTRMDTHTYETIGNTYTDAPLVPGDDTFSKVGVSVIAHQVRGMGTRESVAITIDSDDEETTDRTVSPQFATTSARYFGLAADEFLVELFPLNMFLPLEYGFPYSDIHMSDDKGDIYSPRENYVHLLTRRDASTGDVWTDLEGRRLYRFAGTEEVTVGDMTVNARKVDIFTIDPVDPEASSVLDTCVFVKESVTTEFDGDERLVFGGPIDSDTGFEDTDVPEDTDEPEPAGPEEVTNNVALLDSGCEDNFVHQQIGSEYWFEDTLVKSTTTTYEVEITNYGWEWFEEDEGTCTRRTSTTEPTEEGVESKLFVEYSVTESNDESQATSIGTVDAE